jgi:general L-amino acid transport system permease protein
MSVVLSLARTLTPALLLLGTLAAGLIGRRAGMLVPGSYRRFAPAVGVLGIITFFQTISGFGGVGWNQWGGLLLTILLAVGGIAISFPIGILLALGRRSSLRVVQVVSVAYIELIRGVPLITLLFMGAFVIGFFFPPGITPGLATRALIALVMFTAAYVAEIVRGGLQAVPRGQYEAGQAVGLSPYKVTRLVVLPQALRAVIPAIVGQFISLFKDTSLVVTIGLLDLLAVSESVTSQPQFLAQGLHAETLGFAAFLYWAGSYWMSRSSQRLEKRLGVGER